MEKNVLSYEENGKFGLVDFSGKKLTNAVYEKVESLKRIDEFVDIYLPDMKFYSPTLSKRYLGKEDYFDVASEAIEFMTKKPLVMTEEKKNLLLLPKLKKFLQQLFLCLDLQNEPAFCAKTHF